VTGMILFSLIFSNDICKFHHANTIIRSDAAFDRAAAGTGNAAGFTVVETGTDGITQVTT